MGALLQIRERRTSLGGFPLWKVFLGAAALLMMGFPALTVGGQLCFRAETSAESLGSTASTAAMMGYVLALLGMTFTVGVVLPWKRIAQDAGVLSTLRSGRGLVELLGTRTKPTEILDGIARQTLVGTLREVAPMVPLLALGWLLLPNAHAASILTLSVAALPLLGLMVWASSYLAMAWELWVGSSESSLMSQLLGVGMFILLCPLGACLFIGVLGGLGAASVSLVTGCVWLTGWLVAYAGLNLVVSRRLALVGLDRVPQFRAKVEQAGRRLLHRNRNRWMQPWSENPIVVRETFRDAMRTPGGALGWVILQAPALWLVPATGAFLASQGAPPVAVLIFLGLVLMMAQVAMASSRTMLALVGEVEHSTLEVLQQSRLSAADFCDGWATVGARTRALELLLLAPPAFGLALAGGVNPLIPALWIPLALTAVVFASWAGLWSSFARTRRQAQERLSGLLALAVVISMVVAGYCASALWWPWVLVTCTGGLAVAAWVCRGACLSSLSLR